MKAAGFNRVWLAAPILVAVFAALCIVWLGTRVSDAKPVAPARPTTMAVPF